MSPDAIRAKYHARAELRRRGLNPHGKPLQQAPPLKSSDNTRALYEGIEQQADTLAALRLRKELALANAAELMNRQRCAELVPASLVRELTAKMIAKASDALMRLPGALAERIAVESDPHKVENILAGELAVALKALSEVKQE
jgi:hypothetical protein